MLSQEYKDLHKAYCELYVRYVELEMRPKNKEEAGSALNTQVDRYHALARDTGDS